jgi:preprotein translocase subunit SecG
MTPESNPVAVPSEATPTAENLGYFSRLSGVYFSPSETFAGFKFDKTLFVPIILPILIVMVIGAFSNYVVTERIGYENIMRQTLEPMKEAGWMNQEAYDKAIQQAANRTPVQKILGLISPFLGTGIVILVIAGIFQLFCMVMGVETRFKSLLSVTAYTFLAIGIINVVLLTIIVYLKNPDDIDLYNPIGSNLGALMSLIASGAPKFITALASWIDIFGFWRIALLSIGYAAVSRKLKTSTAAIFLGALYALMALAFSGFASMMG